MKKHNLFIIAICVCVIVFFCYHYIKPAELTINQDESFFMDFYVAENIVHMKCVLSITNHSNHATTFSAWAESKEDVKTGLLQNPRMHGVNTEDNTNFFSIGAGETITFSVDFQGKFHKSLLKKDRLLPNKIMLEICNSND